MNKLPLLKEFFARQVIPGDRKAEQFIIPNHGMVKLFQKNDELWDAPVGAIHQLAHKSEAELFGSNVDSEQLIALRSLASEDCAHRRRKTDTSVRPETLKSDLVTPGGLTDSEYQYICSRAGAHAKVLKNV